MRKLVFALVALPMLATAPAASADHAIGGVGSPYHWANPDSITISDDVTVAGESASSSYNFAGTFADWNAFGSVTLVETSSRKPDIDTERRSYGDRGWVGRAIFWVRHGHFSRVRIQLNDFYEPYFPEYYTPEARQQTLCQELGHALGLDHQYADSCMNDANDPRTIDYPRPNAHDGEQLEAIYAHGAHSSKRGRGGRGKKSRSSERGPYVLDVIPAPGHNPKGGRTR